VEERKRNKRHRELPVAKPNQSSDHLPGLDEAIRIVPAYELVVDRIRLALHMGTYLPGERLPSERAIAEQLGVSRVTVREALRVLQGEHYLRTSRGATGGAVVLQLDEPIDDLRRRMAKRLPEFEAIIDFRLAVECAAARLAARNRTQEHIDHAAQAINELAHSKDLASFRRADGAFHLVIADASGNRLLHRAIQGARAAMFLQLDTIDLHLSQKSSSREHRRVLAAIVNQRPQAAERAMAAHMESTRAAIRADYG
jgi:GntR family transcriptional repressor for pyruvate dehydrogenase complex